MINIIIIIFKYNTHAHIMALAGDVFSRRFGSGTASASRCDQTFLVSLAGKFSRFGSEFLSFRRR